ncbi:LOW QUALITY PROTEIN: hypothetical protein BC938DRAFT_476014 [Jimgerdemannia flammicorona]|uniref:Uncharacterized protein n=1 Tax=Jimgerdemannia flammicorona TaxID=994334 RepID=A0A433PL74_9FUNG|nr:LOW QUALITY PROTEIN: hypothetical protein BC938DRAFT_476014 [Jimgerdemannia flammicorona]
MNIRFRFDKLQIRSNTADTSSFVSPRAFLTNFSAVIAYFGDVDSVECTYPHFLDNLRDTILESPPFPKIGVGLTEFGTSATPASADEVIFRRHHPGTSRKPHSPINIEIPSREGRLLVWVPR